MRKKYYILALTFLCLLIGQNSFGQTTGGDFDNDEMFDFLSNLFEREVNSFETDQNTGYIISVNGTGQGGGERDAFVGFEASNDGTMTFTWGDFNDIDNSTGTPSENTDSYSNDSGWGLIDYASVYSISIPINPNGDCWSCSTETDSNDVASSENYNYFDLLPPWVQTSYLDYVENSNTPIVLPPNTGYSGAVGEVVIWYDVGSPYSMGVAYGPVPAEEVNDLKAIMNSSPSEYHDLIFQLVKNNPGSGLDMIKTFVVKYPNGNLSQLITDYNNSVDLVCTNYPLLCASETFEATNIATAVSVLPKFMFDDNKNNIFNANGRPLRSGIQGNLLQLEIKKALKAPSNLLRTEGTLYALNKIATYYAELKGYNGLVTTVNTKGKKGGDDVAHYGNGTLTVRAIAFSEGKFNNVNDFKSTINHEVLHWKDPRNSATDYQFKDHANIYLLAASDPDFINASLSFKISQVQEYMNRVLNASKAGEVGMNNTGIIAAITKYNNENSGGIIISNPFYSGSLDGFSFTLSINGTIYDNDFSFEVLKSTRD